MASEFRSEFAQLALLINEYGPEDPLRQDANRPPKSTFDGGADGSSESPAPGPSDDGAQGSSDPAPGSVEDTYRYAELRRDGSHCQKMIADPRVACGIPRITLTADDLESHQWSHTRRPIGLPSSYSADALIALGLPIIGYEYITMDLWKDTGSLCILWKGRAAKGVLFIEELLRIGSGPWSSELCKVAYEQVAELSTLSTIFVTHVINSETQPFARTLWQGPGVREFPWGSRGYQTLLGTRIGKVIAYFILGAFGQGVKRIRRIAIWWAGFRALELQMRFDIEDIPATTD